MSTLQHDLRTFLEMETRRLIAEQAAEPLFPLFPFVSKKSARSCSSHLPSRPGAGLGNITSPCTCGNATGAVHISLIMLDAPAFDLQPMRFVTVHELNPDSGILCYPTTPHVFRAGFLCVACTITFRNKVIYAERQLLASLKAGKIARDSFKSRLKQRLERRLNANVINKIWAMLC